MEVTFRNQEPLPGSLLLLIITDTSMRRHWWCYGSHWVTLIRQLTSVYGPCGLSNARGHHVGDTRCTYLSSTHCVTVMTVVTVTQRVNDQWRCVQYDKHIEIKSPISSIMCLLSNTSKYLVEWFRYRHYPKLFGTRRVKYHSHKHLYRGKLCIYLKGNEFVTCSLWS